MLIAVGDLFVWLNCLALLCLLSWWIGWWIDWCIML